ncbi:hypothetical protein AVEN_78629-1 [Araneus ventricosus]|uniref:Uncharacterized protein n=1 Tax=Araneus ventricosus TaxID=182803 RepID=A0A4Y2VQP7_ARAVE|nr:hypothetical protein AVEN_78629-1 [Araneus ventricosus]
MSLTQQACSKFDAVMSPLFPKTARPAISDEVPEGTTQDERKWSLTGRSVSASASEPVDHEFYPWLCSYSVFAIICNEIAMQARPMVNSKLALTCCKLVSHLHSYRVKLAASLQICSAVLLQVCRKLKLLSGTFGISQTHLEYLFAEASRLESVPVVDSCILSSVCQPRYFILTLGVFHNSP